METRYKIIYKKKDLKRLVEACKKTGYCCFDFETNAEPIYLKSFKPTIISISFQPGSGVSIPLAHFETKDYCGQDYNWKKALQYIGHRIIENPKIVKIAQNAKFDTQIFEKYHIYYRGTLLDTMIAKYILNENKPHGLKELVKRYLPEYGDYEKQNKLDKLPWDKKPLDPLCKYGCTDTDMTLRLMMFFEKKLMDLGFYSTFRNLFMTASRVLTSVEKEGLYVDREFNQYLLETYRPKIEQAKSNVMNLPRIKKFQKRLIQERIDKYLAKLEEELSELDYNNPKDARKIKSREDKIANIRAGIFTTKNELALIEPLNLNSSPQVKSLLYTHDKGFKFEILKLTDSGEPSADEETLIKLRLTVKDPKHPKAIFLDNLLELRGLEKMFTTYIKGWNEKVQDDSRLHGRINIIGCVTEDTLLFGKKGDIRIGDICPKEKGIKDVTQDNIYVLAHNSRYEQITHTINKGLHKAYRITTANGRVLECTKGHKLLTPEGMKRVSYILKHNTPIICHDLSELSKQYEVKTGKSYGEVLIKELPEFKGYLVSSDGKVYSVKKAGGHGYDYNNPHEMIPRLGKMGIPRVGLRIPLSRKRYQKNISRLVWETFRGSIPEGMVIDHIDGNRSNNKLDNLQCITYKENSQRSHKLNPRLAKTRGNHVNCSKLDAQLTGKILHRYHNEGISQAELSKEYSLKPMMVSRIINGKTWGYIRLDYIQECEYLGERVIYDLSVNNAHSYITSNGLINSNTDSNRYASQSPNVQQIPKTSVDPNIKKQLVAPPGKLYLACDYSQAELRMMAHLSGDETYLTAFREGVDPHLAIAINKYGANPEEAIKAYNDESHPEYKLWKNRRKQAKQIAFGLIYGIGPGLLAEKLSDPKEGLIVSPEEARKTMDEFFEEHPKILKFKEKQEKFLRKHGYYKQLFGTKRRLPEIFNGTREEQAYALRLGVNFPCQGAAANMTNFGAVLLYWEMRQGKLPMMKECCTVHDALYYYTNPEYINTWTISHMWNILRNPQTKRYFGFQIDDVDMDMDFTIGRSMAEELPFIPGYDYNKLLSPDFSVDEYMQEHKAYKGIHIKEYPNLYAKQIEQYEKDFRNNS